MKAFVLAAVCLLSSAAWSQTFSRMPFPSPPQGHPPATQSAQPAQPNYANYSIMLVQPGGGVAVVLMHNPKNVLEYVEVGKTQEALTAGYVPVRATEITDGIAAMVAENKRLKEENAQLHLQPPQPAMVMAPPAASSPEEVAFAERQRAASEKAARRAQAIQTWIMLQNANRPQTMNMNVTVSNCTAYPALCAGR